MGAVNPTSPADQPDQPDRPDPIRVIIADDHQIWRSGLRADLGPDFHVVAEAADAEAAIAAIDEHEPDLAIVDLHMGKGGGMAVVSAHASNLPIVILTVSEAERDLLDAVAAGAVGFLTKSTGSEDLRSALRSAAAGEPVFSPHLAALVIGEFRRLSRNDDTTGLSNREREVVGLVARGHSYKAVAEQLFISPKTVENHVRNIMAKLHLTRRHELVRWAVERGIT